MRTLGDFVFPEFISSSGLARFCGPCPVYGVRNKEVLRAGTLDTLRYACRRRDFVLNLVHHVEDQSLATMPSTQQRGKTFTKWSGAEVAGVEAATWLDIVDIALIEDW